MMYKRILVPLDGSELAECTLSHLKGLLHNGADQKAILLNVAMNNFDWYTQQESFDYNAFRQNLFLASRQYLENVRNRLNSEGINVDAEILEGNFAAESITEYATKNSIDLILMSTYGKTGKKILMFGSTALSVLHDSPVPVLLIRPKSC